MGEQMWRSESVPKAATWDGRRRLWLLRGTDQETGEMRWNGWHPNGIPLMRPPVRAVGIPGSAMWSDQTLFWEKPSETPPRRWLWNVDGDRVPDEPLKMTVDEAVQKTANTLDGDHYSAHETLTRQADRLDHLAKGCRELAETVPSLGPEAAEVLDMLLGRMRWGEDEIPF